MKLSEVFDMAAYNKKWDEENPKPTGPAPKANDPRWVLGDEPPEDIWVWVKWGDNQIGLGKYDGYIVDILDAPGYSEEEEVSAWLNPW